MRTVATDTLYLASPTSIDRKRAFQTSGAEFDPLDRFDPERTYGGCRA
jgi:hypothetical protein